MLFRSARHHLLALFSFLRESSAHDVAQLKHIFPGKTVVHVESLSDRYCASLFRASTAHAPRTAVFAAGRRRHGMDCVYALHDASHDVRPEVTAPAAMPATGRDIVLLSLVVLPFIPYVYGVMRLDWGFNELSAMFLVVGFAVGIVSGRGVSATAAGFLEGMQGLVAAALFIGVARAMSLVLTDGRVMDTIVYGLATLLASAPGIAAGLLMIPMPALIHVPVPSVSGQAVLTMPLMAPLSDLPASRATLP